MASKKKRDPDYSLNIFHHYDERTKRNVVVFLIQTTKIFISFRYEILLEDEIIGHDINLKITGLHVPELLMPQTGPAQGRRDYTNLDGTYNLIVTKQDKTMNEFAVHISPTIIDIKQKQKTPFILVSNDPVIFHKSFCFFSLISFLTDYFYLTFLLFYIYTFTFNLSLYVPSTFPNWSFHRLWLWLDACPGIHCRQLSAYQ